MKKLLIFSLLCIATSLAPHVFAADGFTALAPIPGLTDISPTTLIGPDSLANFFNNLYKYAVGMAAILAVIMIIWSGLEVATNKENVSSMLESKGRIYNAVFGLILVLSPVLVFSIINPSILNLSLNLPKIQPVSRATSGDVPSQDPTTIINQAIRTAGGAGCSVISSEPGALTTTTTVMECPNTIGGLNAAQAFARACPNSSGRASGIGPYKATCNMSQNTQGDMTTPTVEIPIK